MNANKQTDLPLCVDLDGTLIATDTLWESFLLLLRYKFWLIFLLPFWLTRGKAYLKEQIAQQVTLDVTSLPYHEEVLTFLQQEKQQGRRLILATAAHQQIAQAVAKHLNLFSQVFATDVTCNLKGSTKRDVLVQHFGEKGFDYMGDSKADLPIFQAADQSFLVAPTGTLPKMSPPPARTFTPPSSTWFTWLKAIRPHQWVKNSLLFVPLILSHQLLDSSSLIDAGLAFLAFSFAASAGYLLNDLLDLAADRQHPTKKRRPLAAGLLSIPQGLMLFVLLLITSLTISSMALSASFTGMVLLYLLLTISYSFYFKRKLVIDVVLLASLYTHRILAGGIAVTVPITSWLLAFSMFIFISLAFLKRYTELLQLSEQERIKHRSYQVGDLEMVASFGASNGYLAVLVFALYINSEAVTQLYHSPFLLWLVCPLLLYWITRIWFLAHRQKMLDDPVEFALTDHISWLVLLCIMGLMLLAKFI